jgi:acetate---CoA ligase (ADP-forming)
MQTGTAGKRELYTYDDLQPLVRPGSVAVVGASATKDGFGTRALLALTDAKFPGSIFAVHTSARAGSTIRDVPAVRSLRELPAPVDCVLVATPAAAVEEIVRDAAATGCRSAIIFSAGFGEAGQDGIAAQGRILEVARAHGMRLGGPNTLGILNYRDGLPLTFVSDLAMELPAGRIGIVSQSGGLATHLGHVRHRQIGMSYTITTGNSVDVTALDYVNFLLDDDATDVVILALEGLADPSALAAVGAKALRNRKPILTIKSGRTAAGGRAAVSHTGSLTGDHEVFLAAARQAGIHVVDTTAELIETATMFAKWTGLPYQRGGVCIVTTMGGPGVIAADAATDAGVELPLPQPATVARIADLIPAFAAVDNPIDTTASPPDQVLTEVLVAAAEDPGFSATVILAATMTGPSTAQRPAAIAAAGAGVRTPIAAVWLSNWTDGPGSEVLDADPRIPLFRSSDRCMRAIAAWAAWHERLSAHADESAQPPPSTEPESVAALRAQVAAITTTALDEAQSREIVLAAGIDVPRAHVAHSAADAGRIAAELGFPVVAKVVSADIAHKAAAGGVELGLYSADAVRHAYDRIVTHVGSHAPEARVDGVLIAESLDTSTELMCGVIRDPVFGPVIVCGAGGGAVELMRDVAHAVPPVTETTARAAARRLRIVQYLLDRTPAHAHKAIDALADVMTKLAGLATAVPEIREIDLNPLVLRPDGTPVALDSLVILDR